MMKRMCNLIIFFLLTISGFPILADTDRGACPSTCNTTCDITKCDLREIEQKLCCISNQLKTCCDELEHDISKCCKKTNNNIDACCNRLENDITECCDRLEQDITDCCNEIINTIPGNCEFDFLISSTQLNTGNTTVINQGGRYLLVGGNITIT